VRGIFRRGLRLDLVAGLGIALAIPALAVAAETPQALATQTALHAETRDRGGRTQATVAVTVTGEDGQPAAGAVTINDHGKPLTGVALNAQGQAKTVLALAGGDHLLRAVYAGDATHLASSSLASTVHAQVASTPDFSIAVAPATVTLTPGQSGSVVASVTPEYASALTAPMFVTLSCSGFPDQASCSFTPENIEVLVGATAPLTSTMVITTQAASTASAAPAAHRSANPIAWAFLLPGALGLAGLAWGSRRRRWLSRLSLVALVGLVTVLGATACNPRYNYEHHGPPPNPATPAGTYTLLVTAQSTNGVTATTHSTSMVLTVK